ncbi:MAG TPA: hypothetical protein VFP22_06620 [Candidatus Limnocylindrales bacterium]|nr:hypothetical protein [Candidatus Limnocylindrales bacterium]
MGVDVAGERRASSASEAREAPAGPRLRIRGHARAATLVRTMVAGRAPHAVLIGGPAGVGKTTLALDLAAGLLCLDPDPARRPCRDCRGCRLVDRGIHQDLHRLAPEGAGDQIRIGSREHPEDGTVRRLAIDLSLLPVEGGARVALIERADRMGDDAQSALLKTLEEPPSGVTIILCADDEDRLLPTVRSRCARIRLGSVGVRDVEAILADAGLAEPALAARLARLSGGRPGLAATLARAPDALAARDEIARSLLDLLGRGPAARLVAARELAGRAAALDRLMRVAAERSGGETGGSTAVEAGGRARGRRSRSVTGLGPELSPAIGTTTADPAMTDEGPEAATRQAEDDAAEETAPAGPAGAAPAAERRRAAAVIVGLWRDLTRDLLVVLLGSEREVRDPALLDDLRAAAGSMATAPAGGGSVRGLSDFLGRLDEAGELLEANVRAELILDTLLLAWPTVGTPTPIGPPPARSVRR